MLITSSAAVLRAPISFATSNGSFSMKCTTSLVILLHLPACVGLDCSPFMPVDADIERGVVWEEVIIMLPPHVGLILLSATVHNVQEFADWVGRTKKRKVHVMFTDKRPVPLQHHLWCKGNLFTIHDTRGWQPDGFKQARLAGETDKDREKKKQIAALGRGPGFQKRVQHTSEKSQWTALVNHLKKRELLPVAVFYFSKKKCEENAFCNACPIPCSVPLSFSAVTLFVRLTICFRMCAALTGLDLTTLSEKSEVWLLLALCCALLC